MNKHPQTQTKKVNINQNDKTTTVCGYIVSPDTLCSGSNTVPLWQCQTCKNYSPPPQTCGETKIYDN